MSLHLRPDTYTNASPTRYRTGRVGIARQRVIDDNDIRRRVGIYRIEHPVDSAPTRNLDPSTTYGEVPINFKDLKAGYHVDSYIRQSVDKYAEKVISAGYRIESYSEEIVSYLHKRLTLMSLATDYHFPLLISDIARRYVRDGNVFLVKAWAKGSQPFPGLTLKGIRNRPVIGGYFLLDADCLVPIVDRQSGLRKGWIYRKKTDSYRIQDKYFPIDQIYHYAYCPEGIDGWGHSQLIPAIEDIRALRNAEEAILKLIYRHLNPLIHISAPDISGDGTGRQEDVDLVTQTLSNMPHDGFVVTGPGYEISAIGAESQAIRAEPYLAFFKSRGFAGLGVSDLLMGEGTYVGQGGANALSVQMHDRARFYQFALSQYISSTIIVDLLLEGGYDPLNPDGEGFAAQLVFNEFDMDELRKQEAHIVDMYTKNALPHNEMRGQLKLPENQDFDTLHAGVTAQVERKYHPEPIKNRNND
jgi:hypothetical protein